MEEWNVGVCACACVHVNVCVNREKLFLEEIIHKFKPSKSSHSSFTEVNDRDNACGGSYCQCCYLQRIC